MKHLRKFNENLVKESLCYSCDECNGLWEGDDKCKCCDSCGSDDIEELPRSEWSDLVKFRSENKENND